jgi:hypothetical protein
MPFIYRTLFATGTLCRSYTTTIHGIRTAQSGIGTRGTAHDRHKKRYKFFDSGGIKSSITPPHAFTLQASSQ